MRRKELTEILSTRVTERMHEELTKMARMYRLRVSDMVRLALAQFLMQENSNGISKRIQQQVQESDTETG